MLYNWSYVGLESAMTQAFGNRYINLREYLVSDGLNDLGITPTSYDKQYIQAGVVPESLRASSSSTELKSGCYEKLGKMVYDRMDSLGYFYEINKELGIDKIKDQLLTQQVLDAQSKAGNKCIIQLYEKTTMSSR